jgi:hypothetical protein
MGEKRAEDAALALDAGRGRRGLSHLPWKIGITDAPALIEASQGFQHGGRLRATVGH